MAARFSKWTAVLLCAVLLLTSVSWTAFADENGASKAEENLAGTDWEPVAAGETVNVVLEAGQTEKYAFIAEETASYVIFSANAGSTDPFVRIYAKENMQDLAKVLVSEDEGGVGDNFRVVLSLEQGQEIGIEAGAAKTGSYDLTVVKEALLTLDGNGAGLEGSEIRLEVPFAPGESLGTILEGVERFVREDRNLEGWTEQPDGELIPDIFAYYPEEGQTLYALWAEFPDLTLGVSAQISLMGGSFKRFLFTPEEAGWYAIYTTGGSEADPYGFLYEDTAFKRRITGDDSSGSGSNFRIVSELVGGHSYGIYAGAFETGAFALHVVKASSFTLDGNGGFTLTRDSRVTAGFAGSEKLGAAIDNAIRFFREGYYLSGWSETQDGEPIANLSQTVPTDGATYYAVWEKITELSAGETVRVSLSGTAGQRFLFTPEKSGYYVFHSDNSNGIGDSVCELYGDGFFENVLAESETGLTTKTFLFSYYLEAGTTYGFYLHLDEIPQETFDFTIDQASAVFFGGSGGLTADGESDEVIYFYEGLSLTEVGSLSKGFFKENSENIGWTAEPDGELIADADQVFPRDGEHYYLFWKDVEKVFYGDEKELSIEKEGSLRFLFTPEETANYYFYLTNVKEGVFLELLLFSDSGFQEIMADAEGNDDYPNPEVIEKLKAGKTYGIEICRDFDRGNDKEAFRLTVAKQITVTLDGNGGKTAKDKASVKFTGSSLRTVAELAAKVTFVREHYEQIGWTYEASSDYTCRLTSMPTDGQTVYACWQKEKVTVEYNAGEGTYKSNGKKSYTAEEEYDEPLKNYPRVELVSDIPGKVFDKWYLDKDCTKPIDVVSISIYRPLSDMTLYAGYRWIATPTPTPVPQVKSIRLSKTKATLYLGKKLTLTAKALPTNAVKRDIKWVSGDTKIVKVSSTGVVTPVTTGTVKVWAKTANGTKAFCTVTVVRPPVQSIKLSKSQGTLKVGKKATLTATVSPSYAANKTVTWTSSNSKVATVSKNGVVIAVARGECVITASTKNGVSASCKLTVKQPVKKLTLNKTTVKVKKGKTVKLSVDVAPKNANNKKVFWTSGNPKIATVDAKGVVKGVARGETTITVTAADGSGKTAACKVIVV